LAKLDLPVEIPRVHWEEPSLAYVGYIGVVARDLSEGEVDAERARKFGAAIGSFLRVLHAQTLDVPTHTVEDEIANYQARHRSVVPVLETSFNADELRMLDDFFRRELPATMRSAGQHLCVCHGDLGPWNVIIGLDDTVGVIDFGEAGYRDQSKDFVALPIPALEGALAAYGDSRALRDKVAIRRRAFPITDLPYFIGIGDADGIERRFSDIRREFFGTDAVEVPR
jgi:aminoglycoside phosphotransferase (APT) family kinase protein